MGPPTANDYGDVETENELEGDEIGDVVAVADKTDKADTVKVIRGQRLQPETVEEVDAVEKHQVEEQVGKD